MRYMKMRQECGGVGRKEIRKSRKRKLRKLGEERKEKEKEVVNI